MAEKSYIGKGTIYLGPYADNAKRRNVGNCSALKLAISEENKELPDYQSPGGGKANSLRRITGVECQITLLEFQPENLAVALFGDTAAVASGSVSAEAQTAYQGGLVRTANNIDTTQTVTVTGAGGTPTYTLNTDYTVNAGGIEIVAGGGIADTTAIEISYTKKAGDLIQALTQTGQEYKLTFVGLNEAQSGAPVVVDLHRVKFGPSQGLDLIGDEFGEIPLTGDVLKDSAQATGSQYFAVEEA